MASCQFLHLVLPAPQVLEGEAGGGWAGLARHLLQWFSLSLAGLSLKVNQDIAMDSSEGMSTASYCSASLCFGFFLIHRGKSSWTVSEGPKWTVSPVGLRKHSGIFSLVGSE